MKDRKVIKQVKGYRTTDGAGVSLVRVLGNRTVEEFDPILMLDSFDSTDPGDYSAGFPMHPHRGIETISYIAEGGMVHRDSLGHSEGISDGEVQWMTAGSGIMHEEMIPEAKRILGVQLWLNLPKKDKMVTPDYHSIKKDKIEVIELDGVILKLLAGSYEGHSGYRGKYLPLDYYDIELAPGRSFGINTENDRSVMLFTLSGDAFIGGEHISEKTAVKLGDGDRVLLENKGEEPVRILFMSSVKLGEPAVWGGPIVMNTKEELRDAFRELSEGTFLKEKTVYKETV